MNHRLSRIAVPLALFALCALCGACSRPVTVKIGVVGPMTGTLAQYGKDMMQGATIAVDELNDGKFRIDGRPAHFELVVEDDRAAPEEGKAAAKRLIDAGVVGILGHFNSGVSIAAAPLYANAGIPQMSLSSNPKYTRMGLKTAFRIVADDIQQGAALGRLVRDKLRAKSVYIVDDRTPYGVGQAEEMKRVYKERNIEPPHESLAAAADLAEVVRKVADSGATVLFYGGDQGIGLPLLKALRNSGSQAVFVAGDAMCDASVMAGADGAANSNFYCTVNGVPPSWLSSGIAFVHLHTVKFGAPGVYSPMSYSGIHVLAQAMQRARSVEPGKYLAALAGGSFDGKIQGNVEFDAKGDLKDGTVVTYRSIGGKLVEQRSTL